MIVARKIVSSRLAAVGSRRASPSRLPNFLGASFSPPPSSSAGGRAARVCLSSSALRASSSSSSRSPAAAAALFASSIALLAASRATDERSSGSTAHCHCQVPCGIFDDPIRIALVKEHSATIRKAMIQIRALSSHSSPSGEMADAQSLNQASRWVSVKEEAASDIITIVSEYMLCQGVKKASFKTVDEYRHALELHHVLMQSAMRTKQTVDVAACDALDRAVSDLSKMYVSE